MSATSPLNPMKMDGPESEGEAPAAAPRVRPAAKWRAALALLLGVVLLVLLVVSLDDPSAALRALTELDPSWLALALLAYLASYVCRALRFRALLPGNPGSVADLTAISAVHNLLNMLLPLRSGELSWIYLARTRLGARLAAGAASLVLSRVYDMIGIAAFFLAALFASRHAGGDGDSEPWRLLLPPAVLFALALLLLLALPRIARGGADFLARRVARSALAARLAPPAAALVEQLAAARARGRFVALFLLTEAQWLATFLTCFAILRAHPAGEGFPFLRSILGSTGLSLALILPINPVGNVGTFEAGWIAGYLFAGLDRAAATATALAAHVAILVFAALLGLLGHLWLRRPVKTPA
jgi:uncharacterized protein (TIRG00374 family)